MFFQFTASFVIFQARIHWITLVVGVTVQPSLSVARDPASNLFPSNNSDEATKVRDIADQGVNSL